MSFDFDLGSALDALPFDLLQHFRPVGGARVDGLRKNQGFVQLEDFEANVQPTTPEQISFITGGEEVDGLITIYNTKTELQVGDGQDGGADHLIWKGTRYKVMSAAPWGTYGFRSFVAGPAAAGGIP